GAHARHRRPAERRLRAQDGADGGCRVSAVPHSDTAAAVAVAVTPRAAAARRQRRRRLRRAAWNVVGLVVTVVMAFPVYWMISTPFKPDDEIYTFTPTWIPTHPTLDHFRDAIDPSQHPYFWDGVKNSMIVVAATVAVAMVLAFLAAVSLAKYRFSGRSLVIVLMIGILMLPQVGLIIPLYVVLARYHLTNALLGVIIVYLTF